MQKTKTDYRTFVSISVWLSAVVNIYLAEPSPPPPLKSRPHFLRLGGLGERSRSPSGSGRSPATKRILLHFWAKIKASGGNNFSDFPDNQLINPSVLRSPSPPFDNIYSYGDCLEVNREYYQNRFIYCQRATSSMPQLTKTVHTARLGLEFVFLCFFGGCMICLYVHVCFVLPWSVESFPFMFWRWRN